MKKFNLEKIFEQWASMPHEDDPEMMDETCNEMPEPGDTIRTKKMQMEGKVERIGQNRAGYDEVYFRIADGRLMKTPVSNVTVVEKLADDDNEIMENQELLELSNELLTKYKTKATDASRAADAVGDIKTGNKRFSGVVKATNKQFANDAKKAVAEGSMGGINRSRPAQDVSYEHVLDRNPETEHSRVIGEIYSNVKEKWEAELNELSVNKLRAYKDAARSSNAFKTRPMRKLAKTSQNIERANDKIDIKTGNRTGERRIAAKEAEDPFKKQLNKQYKEVKKTEERDYNGWKIRYQLVPTKPGEPIQWMAWHGKGDVAKAHKGTSANPKQAWDDATAWINSGGGEQKQANKRVIIDFNTDFSKQFAPNNEPFYATIDDGYLLFSADPAPGLKHSVKRHSDRYIFQSITLSPEEANEAGTDTLAGSTHELLHLP